MMRFLVPVDLISFVCFDSKLPVHVVERQHINGRPNFVRKSDVRCEHECGNRVSDTDVISTLIHENNMLKQRLSVAESAAKNLSAYAEDLEKICVDHGIDLSEYTDSCVEDESTNCGVQGACKFVGIPNGAEVCSCSHCGGVCDKRPQ